MFLIFILNLIIFICGEISQINSQSINNTEHNLVNKQMKNRTPMHKVLFTQRGYIQFLRWELTVPEINEFTFCLWIKSTNLTYPHSIFSYSKNEKDRLVRAWIGSNGQSIHLEINNIEIFNQPTSIQVNQWYHICQSWDNERGRYGLWIDGQNILDDYAPEMAGHVIQNDGDIVLGQEYTDFDKGLEEGIEGAALGFNLLLASSFESSRTSFEQNNQLINEPMTFMSGIDLPEFIPPRDITKSIGPALFPQTYPLSYRYPRKSLPLTRETIKSISNDDVHLIKIRNKRQTPIVSMLNLNINNRDKINYSIPLGLRLIQMGFYHCEIGRGSPFIGGERLLISWTRTPVKIFGGAIIKNTNNKCGVFN